MNHQAPGQVVRSAFVPLGGLAMRGNRFVPFLKETLVAIDVESICQKDLDLIGPDESVATGCGNARSDR